MRKINILCLAQDYFIGGGEIMLFNLLKYIDRKRFNCVFCCYKKSGVVLKLAKKSNCKIVVLKEDRDIRQQFKVILEKYRIDVVYLTTFKYLPEAVLLKSFGCKIIYHMHNLLGMTHDKLSAEEKRKFLKSIFCLSDKIISCSNAVGKQFDFIKEGAVKDVILYGIEVERYSSRKGKISKLRKQYNISHAEKVVSVIGRITPGKGQRAFIKACKEIKKEYNNVKFFIIGYCVDKDYYRILENDIKNLALTKDVFLTGFKNDIAGLIQDIDIVVLPSRNESFGISLLEAMAAGKVAIGVKDGGIPELIKNNKNGILIESADPVVISRAVLAILNNYNKRKYIGANARKDASKRYRVEIFTKKIEAVFKKAMVYKENQDNLCQQ